MSANSHKIIKFPLNLALMTFRFSCPHTSQNDKAERVICTINNIINILLFDATLFPSFWVYALENSKYLLNILPTNLSKESHQHMLYLE